MTDIISKERRSWNMSRIRAKNTKPEMVVRSALHKAGYRFRIHVPTLPGKPDIVLPKYKAVIFVNGCFWHRHLNCKHAYTPKSRQEFWQSKFQNNIARQEKVIHELHSLGWEVLLIWECEINSRKIFDMLDDRLLLKGLV
ncbi:MAG TPA: very short patch repair endonuclease [Geobacter sp.]|nr:very short patch repair endonuclease [Geobacter sp.]